MLATIRDRFPSRRKMRHYYGYCAFILMCLQIILFGLIYCATGAEPLSDIQKQWLAKAHRYEKNGWIYLHIQGSARERGFQHGWLLAKEIERDLQSNAIDWEHSSAMTWSWLVEKSTALFKNKIDRENLAEINGIVEGLTMAGVKSSRQEIIASNAIIELSGYWWPQELKKIKDGKRPPVKQSCSSFIATGHWTVDGGIVLGHNTMSSYQTTFPNVIIDILPEKGHRILMQTSPGWIHSGTDFFITDAGLVGSETTIGGFEGFDPKGIPEFIRMRRACQDASTLPAWCDIMKHGNNGGYANAWLVGDINTNEIVRLELGLHYTSYEKKQDGYFTGSNIAEDMKILRFETSSVETDIRESSVARRLRWKQLMTQFAGRIDLEAAKQFEADHYDVFLGEERPGGRDLCGHFDMDREPAGSWPGVPYGPAGTIDAKVVDSKMAKKMSFAARWGSACGTAFDAKQFLTDHPQFEWMQNILQSRPSQPWVNFQAGEQP
jgi:hypothetical protein